MDKNDFKIGDVVAHKANDKIMGKIRSFWGDRVILYGFPITYHTKNLILVERSPAHTP